MSGVERARVKFESVSHGWKNSPDNKNFGLLLLALHLAHKVTKLKFKIY